MVGKPEVKRSLGRPRHRWEDNIKTDLTEIGFEGVNWIHLAQDRYQWQALVSMVVNLWFPINLGNFLSGWTTAGFLRRTQLCEVV
jgi:hypothetical protein